MPCHLSQGVVANSGAMHASHVTNPREASHNESECDTWTSHGSMDPPEHLNRLKSTCTLGTNLRAHRTATPRKHNPRGPHLGSANPWIGRTDLGSAHPGPPHGACPLVLGPSPRCFTPLGTGAQAYKYKGRGFISYKHILLLLSHFWFLRLRGRLE
jgi:hypothetical protein